MTVRQRIEELKANDFMVYHKALKDTQLLEDDWIRVYTSRARGCIDKLLFACDRQDVDSIPDDILDLEFDYVDCWVIGSNLSSDMVIRG